MSDRRRCAETGCRHAPRAHTATGCRLCSCKGWLERKPHHWRREVSEAWLCATLTWAEHREQVAIGYPTEMAEFEEKHPRPRLADFMAALSPGQPADTLARLFDLSVCSSCQGTGRQQRTDVAS